jgi:hypothetical protein
MDYNIFQPGETKTQYSDIPSFHYSNCEGGEPSSNPNRGWIIAQGIVSLGKNFLYLFPLFFGIFIQI